LPRWPPPKRTRHDYCFRGGCSVEFLLCWKTVKSAIDALAERAFVEEVGHGDPILRRERVAVIGVVHAKAVLRAEEA